MHVNYKRLQEYIGNPFYFLPFNSFLSHNYLLHCKNSNFKNKTVYRCYGSSLKSLVLLLLALQICNLLSDELKTAFNCLSPFTKMTDFYIFILQNSYCVYALFQTRSASLIEKQLRLINIIAKQRKMRPRSAHIKTIFN